MKKLLMLLFCCLCMTQGNAQGNAQDNFKGEFDDFRNESKKDYDNFRKQCFAEYIEFVREAWTEMGVERPIPLPADEDYLPEIAGDEDPETNSWFSRQASALKKGILGIFSSKKKKADKEQEDAALPKVKENGLASLSYEKIQVKKDKFQQPQPLAPVEEDIASPNDYYTFVFFGTEYKVRMGDNCRFTLKDISENSVADALKNMLNTQFDNILYDCLELRKEHHLSDWAYYNMLCSLVDSFYGKDTNESNLVLAFLYMQSGYKIRMGHDHEHVYVMMASRHSICGKYYFNVDGDKFYVLRGKDPDRMSICEVPFMKEMGLSLQIPEVQDFAFEATSPRTITSIRYPEFSFTVSLNKNLVDFYGTYPASTLDGDFMTKWVMYANAPVVEEVRNQLYPQMKTKLDGLSECDAVNRLLNWVQTGFDYKLDSEVWGGDRPFFGEETLFYPYCDCEDRAILLSHLVRDLMGLNAALVYVPGHLAMAVEFNEEVDGCYFDVDGRRFVFCDPTFINGRVGEYSPMSDMNKAQLVLLEESL